MNEIRIYRYNFNDQGLCVIPHHVKKVLRFGSINGNQPCVWAEVYPGFDKPAVGQRTVVQSAVTGGSPPHWNARYLGTEQFGTVTLHGYVMTESDIHKDEVESLGELW